MEKITLIPKFIEANNKRDLMQMMLNTNIAHKCHFKYFDIQKDGKKWVAWFYADVENDAIRRAK